MLYSDEICANILGNGINVVPERAPTLGRSLSPSFFNNSKNIMKSVTWLHFKGNFKVYLLTCDLCHIHYVGRTTRRLCDRFIEHIYSVTKNQLINVAKHFNMCHDGNISAMRVQVIDKIEVPKKGGDIFIFLCRREVYWIFHLQTRIPRGLNFEWDVSHFYE